MIGARAFQGNTVLESVELPDGLTTIYAYAFENCTSITSIHLPDSITTLGYKVFGGCSNLVSANYPVNWVNSPSGNGSNSYEYGNVFSGCPKLTEIEIPEGVKVIAPHSFASLTTLTSVTLPSSLTEIGASSRKILRIDSYSWLFASFDSEKIHRNIYGLLKMILYGTQSEKFLKQIRLKTYITLRLKKITRTLQIILLHTIVKISVLLANRKDLYGLVRIVVMNIIH